MTKETLVLMIGFIFILLPSLGIPEDWKWYVVIAGGNLLLLLGYLLLRDRFRSHVDLGNGERSGDTFIETTRSLFEDK